MLLIFKKVDKLITYNINLFRKLINKIIYMSLIYPALISSVFEVCVTQPIDVMKIHYQTSTPVIYKFKNLYAGFTPRALGNIPSRTIFLYSQDFFKMYFKDKPYNSYSPLLIPICAGFSQTLVDTPVEVLKINKVMNINNKFLYKGFIPHVSRNIIFLACVYNFREYFKSESIYKNAFYGAIGGTIGAYISHPFDTIKTRIQSNKDYKGLTIKELYKGAHLRASMSMINMFISLSVFELIKILDLF